MAKRTAFLLIAAICCVAAASSDSKLAPIPGLTAIQDELSAVDFNGTGYYAQTYRHEEDKYWQTLTLWMREDASKRPVQRILDIGCGYGTLLAWSSGLYRASGFCMDVNPYLNADFAKKHSLDFQKGNIELDDLPWKEQFDVILLTEVLEHFNFQPVPTLKKIRAALRPGGRFYLSTPDEKEWGRLYTHYQRLKDLPLPKPGVRTVDEHIWIYNRKELLGVLAEAGFRVLRLDYSPGAGHRHFNVEAAAE